LTTARALADRRAAVVEAGRDHRHAHVLAQPVVDHGTEMMFEFASAALWTISAASLTSNRRGRGRR